MQWLRNLWACLRRDAEVVRRRRIEMLVRTALVNPGQESKTLRLIARELELPIHGAPRTAG